VKITELQWEIKVTKKADTEHAFTMPEGKDVVKVAFAEIVVEQKSPLKQVMFLIT